MVGSSLILCIFYPSTRYDTCTCDWSSLRGSGGSSGTTVTFGRMTQKLCCHSPPSRYPLPPCWTLSAAYCLICCLQNSPPKKRNVGEILVGNRDGGRGEITFMNHWCHSFTGERAATVLRSGTALLMPSNARTCAARGFSENICNSSLKNIYICKVFFAVTSPDLVS